MSLFLALILIAQMAAPVAFAAIGETISQRSGMINIGLEGMMLACCWAAVAAGSATGSCWIGLGAALALGIALGLAQGLFTVVLATDQVVAGTAINLAALGITGLAFDWSVANRITLVSPQLPRFGPFDILLVGLPVLAVGLSWLIRKTELGLILRACGEYPAAAESAGFSVVRMRLLAVTIGGFFAGAAGAYLTLGIAGAFVPNMTVGRGFIAIALVTFGRWRVEWVLASTFLVGSLEWLQIALQGRSPVPVQVFMALPYVAALLVLIAMGKGTQAPQNLGVPYEEKS